MSYLVLPRIHFLGRMAFYTPTANNNNWSMVLDPEKVDLFEPFKSMSDDDFRMAMRTRILKHIGIYNIPDEEVLNANWNYDGNNRAPWNGVRITGTESPGAGPCGNRYAGSASEDPLVGLSLAALGDGFGDRSTPPVIVDNDPTSNITSQIFSSKVVLGDPSLGFRASSNESGPLPRTYSRWIYLSRNLAVTPDTCFSAVWQQAIPKANLEFFGLDRSPVLAALAARAEQGLGLMLRYCVYYCVRGYTDAQLAELFAAGQAPVNVSEGVVLGTIGAWDRAELGSSLNGRRLNPGAKPIPSPNPNPPIPQYTLAPAVAQFDAARSALVLDLITAFPEVTPAAEVPPVPPGQVPIVDPGTMAKVNLGDAKVMLRADDGSLIELGTLPFEAYDTRSYLRTAGLVEIPIPPSLVPRLETGNLEVHCTGASDAQNPVLAEKAYVAETDDRALYLTEGDSATVRVQITRRGKPVTDPVRLGVQQYRMAQLPGGSPPDPLVPGADPRIPYKFYLLVDPPPGMSYSCQPPSGSTVCPPPAQPFLKIGSEQGLVTPDAEGFVDVPLSALCPGLGNMRFVPGPDGEDPAYAQCFLLNYYIDCLSMFWNAVRVLPADDDLGRTPDEAITWELVYDKVLRFYYRMYPTMDAHMRLNDKEVVKRCAPILIQMIDAKQWYSTLYMPVTRDMSRGKCELLRKFCAKVIRGQPV